jgi:hypothetical protein
MGGFTQPLGLIVALAAIHWRLGPPQRHETHSGYCDSKPPHRKFTSFFTEGGARLRPFVKPNPGDEIAMLWAI